MNARSPLHWAALAAVLAGCAQSPSTRFYALLPAVPAAAPASVGSRGGPIRVIAVHVPQALDRPEMVRQGVGSEVVLRDFDRWAAPLGQLVRETLTEDLLDRMPPGDVQPPDAPAAPTRRDLVVDILSFRQSRAEGVLEVSWTLLAVPAPGRPSTRILRLTAPSASTGAGDEADLLSRLLAQASDEIARELQRLPAQDG